jgi:hypothetical protein
MVGEGQSLVVGAGAGGTGMLSPERAGRCPAWETPCTPCAATPLCTARLLHQHADVASAPDALLAFSKQNPHHPDALTARCHAVQLLLFDGAHEKLQAVLADELRLPLWLTIDVVDTRPTTDKQAMAAHLVADARRLKDDTGIEWRLGHAARLHPDGSALAILTARHRDKPVREAVARGVLAQAQLQRARSSMRAFAVIPAPRSTRPLKPKQLATLLKHKVKALQDAQAMLMKVFDFRHPQSNIEAMYLVGAVYRQFADWIGRLPVPKMSREASEVYRSHMDDLAMPIMEKAIQAWRTGLARAHRVPGGSEWTRRMDTELAEIDPGWARPWATVMPAGPWTSADGLPRRIRTRRGRSCAPDGSNGEAIR